MKVFKFGGASVKDADAVRNIESILKLYKDEPLLVVISAMGKTTNALEKVVKSLYTQEGNPIDYLSEVKEFHKDIMDKLFSNPDNEVYDQINNYFTEIEWVLEDDTSKGYDFIYDQIVCFGELISTRIIQSYLKQQGANISFLDARDCVITDNSFRQAKINWAVTSKKINDKVPAMLSEKSSIIITQGFIGSTSENFNITLGREGSDYSASIFAYSLEAEGVYIWKDVPGVLNADPKFFEDAQPLESLNSRDAIELAYFGASVIHPKTIQPLENKNIPLYVKSFMKPDLKGTIISNTVQTKPLIPCFIFKKNQVLISISSNDFTFIAEDNLRDIFSIFSEHAVRMNVMQNSAISFSVCIDEDKIKLPLLIDSLQQKYLVLYNDKLELYTIRHYFQSTIDDLTQNREILLEQRSRNTVQLLMKSE
ncbi:MAG TPA: aspartate kinase [Bacteroidia bacterium]|nr:aspartate kinase [Bacteroidia bacterium]HNT80033.1 aspartate kinase [Bacteroidia bacterium]